MSSLAVSNSIGGRARSVPPQHQSRNGVPHIPRAQASLPSHDLISRLRTDRDQWRRQAKELEEETQKLRDQLQQQTQVTTNAITNSKSLSSKFKSISMRAKNSSLRYKTVVRERNLLLQSLTNTRRDLNKVRSEMNTVESEKDRLKSEIDDMKRENMRLNRVYRTNSAEHQYVLRLKASVNDMWNWGEELRKALETLQTAPGITRHDVRKDPAAFVIKKNQNKNRDGKKKIQADDGQGQKSGGESSGRGEHNIAPSEDTGESSRHGQGASVEGDKGKEPQRNEEASHNPQITFVEGFILAKQRIVRLEDAAVRVLEALNAGIGGGPAAGRELLNAERRLGREIEKSEFWEESEPILRYLDRLEALEKEEEEEEEDEEEL